MSDLVITTNVPTTTISTTNNVTNIDVTQQVVQVAVQTSGLQGIPGATGPQGASYAEGDPIYVTVTNKTGSTLSAGSIVYTSGANGVHTQVSLAQASGESTSARTLGWLAEDIANNADGLCMVEGYLDGVNTQGITEGAQLYLSPTVAGGFTATKPQAPNHMVYVGVCSKASAGNGRVYVKVQNGYELNEIHDVQIISVANNDVIRWDSTASLWKNVASTALTVGTATFATSATSASTAQQAGTAVYSLTSGSAYSSTFLSGSITKSQVSDFTSGTVASASTAQQAGTAFTSTFAGTATYAGTASLSGTAVYATNSGTAVYGTTAGSAFYATYSGTATVLGGSITSSQVSDLSTTLSTAIVANISGTVTQAQVSGLASTLAGYAALGSANTFTTGAQTIQTGAGTNKGLVVRGAATQSVNLFEIQNNDGSTAIQVNSANSLLWGGASGSLLSGTNGRILAVTTSATIVPATFRGAASQSANLLEIQDSSASTVTSVTSAGIFSAAAVRLNNAGLNSFGGAAVANQILTVNANSSAYVPLVVKGASGQSANLQEWQNSGATVVAKVDSNGVVYGATVRTIQSNVALLERNSGGEISLLKQTAATTNPGSGYARIYLRDGTTAGTLKLVVRAGASGAETTILDNIPQT